MTIFKSKSKTALDSEYKYVGVQLPQHIHQYVSLYSVANGVTKSMVVRDLLSNWINELSNSPKESESELLSKIYEKVKEQWLIESGVAPTLTKHAFLSKVSNELEYKGLSQNNISLISHKLLNGKN